MLDLPERSTSGDAAHASSTSRFRRPEHSGVPYGAPCLRSAKDGDTPVQRTGMGDHLTGMGVAGMVSAALLARERTGTGQLVTTSLTRMAAWQLSTDHNLRLMVDRPAPRTDRATEENPVWNNYKAADGELLAHRCRGGPTLAGAGTHGGQAGVEGDPALATLTPSAPSDPPS
jgi:crotonobetainyl-CoA:carnitine CoA-transferase CaiB-like acyl-CoA transferase